MNVETEQDTAANTDSVETASPKKLKKKSKRAAKRSKAKPVVETNEGGGEIAGDPNTSEAEAAAEVQQQTTPARVDRRSGDKVCGVIIHATDRLKTKVYISHPVVKVHLVDSESGQYLKTSQRFLSRGFTDHASDYVPPQSTRQCEFRKHMLPNPVWEELLVFNESLNWITSLHSLFLFELMDYSSMYTVAERERATDVVPSSAWHRIAWAFLKVLKPSNEANSGNKLRLQLFRAPKGATKPGQSTNDLEVYQWWRSKVKVRYPGTLYVTLKPLEPAASARGISTAVHTAGEAGAAATDNKDDSYYSETNEDRKDEPPPLPIWSRIAEQPCKVPNYKLANLALGKEGCFTVKFSNTGRWLACATRDTSSKHSIHLVQIPECIPVSHLNGHLNLVYDICWSSDDTKLITASADCTARLWSVRSGRCVQVLAHATFVYCAQFWPGDDDTLLTGAYDGHIRLWQLNATDDTRLLADIDAHTSGVNSMCLSADGGKRLFTADGKGELKVWKPTVTSNCETETAEKKTATTEHTLEFVRNIRNDDISGKAVHRLFVTPDSKNLVVQSRDNCIRTLDMRAGYTKHKLVGGTFGTLHIRGDVSPCGRLCFSGSDNGSVTVWSLTTGEKLGEYSEEAHPPAISVAYHPFDHIIAVAHYGATSATVAIYKHDVNTPELAKEHEISTSASEQKRAKENDRSSYMDFSVRDLLEYHKVLTKMDSLEERRMEAKNRRRSSYDIKELSFDKGSAVVAPQAPPIIAKNDQHDEAIDTVLKDAERTTRPKGTAAKPGVGKVW